MAVTTHPLTAYSDLELALMVLLGFYGNGQDRKNRLGSRYVAVQSIVEQILRGSVPAGSGNIKTDTVEKAVRNVFQDCINNLTKEIVNEL